MSTRLIFTTSFHTRFPKYVRARFRIPESLSYALGKTHPRTQPLAPRQAAAPAKAAKRFCVPIDRARSIPKS
jgi:hypothetical protein